MFEQTSSERRIHMNCGGSSLAMLGHGTKALPSYCKGWVTASNYFGFHSDSRFEIDITDILCSLRDREGVHRTPRCSPPLGPHSPCWWLHQH